MVSHITDKNIKNINVLIPPNASFVNVEKNTHQIRD
jgi:hypothetical protein